MHEIQNFHSRKNFPVIPPGILVLGTCLSLLSSSGSSLVARFFAVRPSSAQVTKGKEQWENVFPVAIYEELRRVKYRDYRVFGCVKRTQASIELRITDLQRQTEKRIAALVG